MALKDNKSATPTENTPQQSIPPSSAPISHVPGRVDSTLQGLLNRVDIKKRFEALLGAKAPAFVSSIISLQNSNAQLKAADPKSIIAAAAIAASMDLPINPGLGFAHIVPYGTQAQFQMGWKGYVQLAVRTQEYKTIHATEIYEGELISYNRLSGETVIDEAHRTSDKIVGYIAYFKTKAGYEKTLYMTADQVRKHAQRYSKSYGKAGAPWQNNFDAMAIKTVIKLLLSKWAILSVQMQKAVEFDQGVAVVEAGTERVEFLDNPEGVLEAEGISGEGAAAPVQPPTTNPQVSSSELFGSKE